MKLLKLVKRPLALLLAGLMMFPGNLVANAEKIITLSGNGTSLSGNGVGEGECMHYDTKEVPGKEATCYEDGYTAGVQCLDCEKFTVRHEEIEANHVDEDDSGVCDRCKKTMPEAYGYCGDWIWVGNEDDEWEIRDHSSKYYKYANGELEIVGNGAIGKWAFEDWDDIKNVTIYEGITSIGNQSFYDCDSLETVIIPNSVATIGNQAFRGCGNLESVIIPDSVTSIGEDAFAAKTVIWCTKGSYAETYAKKNDLPYVLSDGGDALNIITGKFGTRFTWTLDKRTGLLELKGSGKIPSLSEADAPWQAYAPYITKISFPEGITEIGSGFFEDLNNLKDIYSPSIEEWMKIQFYYNSAPMSYAENLYFDGELAVDIKIPEGTEEIKDYAFYGYEKLESVTIPASVTEIGYCGFAYCTSLSKVTFEVDDNNWSALTVFDYYAFAGCSIEKMIVPASVSKIKLESLDPSIEELTIYNPECDITTDCGLTLNTVICGFAGSTAEKLADDLAAVFVDVEEEHEHVYKAVGTVGYCKRERCVCGKEKTAEHKDKANDGICDVCKKSTDDLSVTKVTSVDLRHKEKLWLSFTAPEDGVYIFTVDGLAGEIGLSKNKDWDDAYWWGYTAWETPPQITLDASEKIYFGIINNNDYTLGAKISLTYHVHDYQSEVVDEGSCTEPAQVRHACSCGDTYWTSEWNISHICETTIKKATLYLNGRIIQKCTLCGTTVSTDKIYIPSRIELNKTKYSYTGNKVTPSVIVTDAEGYTLKKGTDYKVTYSSDTRKNVGEYTATVTFMGNYSGTKKLSFYILPTKTSKITPTSTASSVKATWKKVTGATGYKVELLSSAGNVKKTAYTTSLNYTFKSLSKATVYKVRVTAYKTVGGVKHYSLSSSMITTATAPAKSTLKVTAGTKQAALSWNKVSGTGYQIVYSTKSDFTSAKTVTVTSSSTVKKTIKSLTKGKNYYFKVRAYKTVNGTKIYGSYSSVVKVKIK